MCLALNVRHPILYVILSRTGSQCKSFKVGEISSNFRLPETTRAREFWILCSFAMFFRSRPVEKRVEPGRYYCGRDWRSSFPSQGWSNITKGANIRVRWSADVPHVLIKRQLRVDCHFQTFYIWWQFDLCSRDGDRPEFNCGESLACTQMDGLRFV